jgi:hypothetical protein
MYLEYFQVLAQTAARYERVETNSWLTIRHYHPTNKEKTKNDVISLVMLLQE